MKKISNELSSQFATVEGRLKLMELYGDSEAMYSGENEDGESVVLSIAHDSIILKTFQKNGWTKVNYYDECGFPEGETFEGRWR